MAAHKDKLIVECARRLVKKLESGEFYTLNGEFSKPVQVELERLKNHCREAEENEIPKNS